MVLTVAFDEFPEAARRVAGAKDVYVSGHGQGSIITAADPHKNSLVVTHSSLSVPNATAQLESIGFNVFPGAWSESHGMNGIPGGEMFVAAVAYASRDAVPGLWMDAYPTQPTPQIVLRAMFDEFAKNDEIGNVSYEDFIRAAHPNVVILGPSEIETYIQLKEEC
jgi:hypothetical protein